MFEIQNSAPIHVITIVCGVGRHHICEKLRGFISREIRNNQRNACLDKT